MTIFCSKLALCSISRLPKTQRGLRRNFDRHHQRLFELTLAVGTLRHRSRFEPLLNQVAGPAIRALLLDRLAPRHEIAVGIPVATEESLALLRPPLHHFAFRAVGAGNADGLLLHVFAFRIRAARRELAESPVLQHQIVAALRALSFQRPVRLLLRPADLLRRLTIRITRAGVKLPEASLLEHHLAAAILAVFLSILLAQAFGASRIGRQLARVR